jgi:hypothetical protein
MLKLISESRQVFTDKRIHLKLFRRFWRTLYVYHEGQTYEQVLRLFFGSSSSGMVQSHRKITNTNLKCDD